MVNPFQDMVARVKEAPRTKGEDEARGRVKKRKKVAGKNVLSFGGEEGGDDVVAPVVKKDDRNHRNKKNKGKNQGKGKDGEKEMDLLRAHTHAGIEKKPAKTANGLKLLG